MLGGIPTGSSGVATSSQYITPVTGSGSSGVQDTNHDIFFAAVETTRMPMIVTDVAASRRSATAARISATESRSVSGPCRKRQLRPSSSSNTGPHTPVTGSGSSGVQDTNHDIFFAAVETTRMPSLQEAAVAAEQLVDPVAGHAHEGAVGEHDRVVGERREAATEILNYRKDGSSFWNALFVSPVFNRSGELLKSCAMPPVSWPRLSIFWA
jgi:hypothetical protein